MTTPPRRPARVVRVLRLLALRSERYTLPEDALLLTGITGYSARVEGATGGPAWVELHPSGVLYVRAGYQWDGPSGPAVDTPGTLRPSLAHDVLCLLTDEGALPWSCRAQADRTYRDLLLEHGVPRWRARLHYAAVRVWSCTVARLRRAICATLSP